jgi:hypothetical protein
MSIPRSGLLAQDRLPSAGRPILERAMSGPPGNENGSTPWSVRLASQRNSQDGQCVFCPGGTRPPAQVLKAYINQYRDVYGVEPTCVIRFTRDNQTRCTHAV